MKFFALLFSGALGRDLHAQLIEINNWKIDLYAGFDGNQQVKIDQYFNVLQTIAENSESGTPSNKHFAFVHGEKAAEVFRKWENIQQTNKYNEFYKLLNSRGN